MNLFQKIRDGFSKTRESFSDAIKSVIGSNGIDEAKLAEMEEILIGADLGFEVSTEIIESIRTRSRRTSVSPEAVMSLVAEELDRVLRSSIDEVPLKQTSGATPRVVFVVGVNGGGKTTTIGKLANYYSSSGKRVLIVAADTFRSAAVEQIAIWAERAGVEMVRGATGADPGSVVYDGLTAALNRGYDIVFIDTAGRLNNKINLMNELEKLNRVAKKIIADAPHEVLLVIDGATGQNGVSQAKSFTRASGVTGLVVTKLDGTAKGGVIVPIAKQLGIPVKWIGLGEGIDDLVPFDPALVVRAVTGVEI